MVLPSSSGTADNDTPLKNLARFGWLKLDDNPAHGPCDFDFNKKRAEPFLPFKSIYTDGVPRMESVSNFDSVCSETSYLTELDWWNQQAHADPTIPKAVAFISMRGNSKATVPAAISRSCRYLVVKLLRAQGEFHNIDVEYVGAHGWSGRCLRPCRTAVLN